MWYWRLESTSGDKASFGSILRHSFIHGMLKFEVLLDGDKADLIIGSIRGKKYADGFLAL